MSDARAGGAPSGRPKRGSDREEGQGDTPTTSRPRSHGPSHGAAADDVDDRHTANDDAPVRGPHLAVATPAQPAQLAGQISTLGDLLRATNVHVGKSKQRRPLYAGGPQRCAHGEQIQPGARMSDAWVVHPLECGGRNFVEEDMAMMVKQRRERPLRLNTLVTRVLSGLSEKGDAKGRHLIHVKSLQPLGHRKVVAAEGQWRLKVSRKVRAQAADRDVWDPEAQWAYMPSCVDELMGLMHVAAPKDRDLAFQVDLTADWWLIAALLSAFFKALPSPHSPNATPPPGRAHLAMEARRSPGRLQGQAAGRRRAGGFSAGRR
jgi:hypothetical protein